MTNSAVLGEPTSTPEQRRLQRAWYWYDWACTGYLTVSITVLFGPYVTSLANKTACPTQSSSDDCHNNLDVLGIGIAPGSLVAFTLTAATIISAVVLIFVGGFADRSRRPTRYLAVFAVLGSLFAMAMHFILGNRWQLAVVLLIAATICFGASLIVYSAIMVRITPPDDRDRVSTVGWAFGYLSGGLLLVIALVFLKMHDTFGMDTRQAVRWIFLMAGVWWLAFTVHPVRRLAKVPGPEVKDREHGPIKGSLLQLRETFGELRSYPQTMRFLVAYLFFNDGVQTVISAASLYGKLQLKFTDDQLVLTILLVQFVAFFGALGFSRLSRHFAPQRIVLWSLLWWTAVVTVAFFLPPHNFTLWLLLATGIGLVLGGSQSLSRSLYSHLIPRGRESEFFSLYQAMERGTSWSGTFVFGLVYQIWHDYRLSILALILFFAIGGLLLRRVNVRAGIEAAGNPLPRMI